MSNKKEFGVCPECGTELIQGARFCSFCGAKINIDIKTEDKPKVEIAEPKVEELKFEEPKFDPPLSDIGTSEDTEKSVPKINITDTQVNRNFEYLGNVDVQPVKLNFGEVLEDFFSKKLVCRILVLVIAVCLFALSFVPVSYSRAEVVQNVTSDIYFNTIDVIVLSVRSFFFLDDAQLVSTDLYIKAQSPMGATLKDNLALTVMSKNTSFRLSIILAGLISIVYIGYCITLLAFSIIELIKTLKSIKKGTEKDTTKNRISDRLLLGMLCFFPIVIFLFLRMSNFGISPDYAMYSNEGFGLSMGAILSLILLIFGCISVCIFKSVEIKRESKKYFTKARVMQILCIFVISTMLLSVFLPCLNINVFNKVTKNEKSAFLSITDFSDISYEESNSYVSHDATGSYSAVDKYANDILLDIGEGNVANKLFNELFYGSERFYIGAFNGTIAVLTFLVLLFVGLLLFLMLENVFFQKNNGKIIKIFRIITLAFTSMEFLVLFVLRIVARIFLYDGMYSTVDFSLGIGPILMVVCAVATMFFFIKTYQKRRIDNDYDNADCSYSPYVVKK